MLKMDSNQVQPEVKKIRDMFSEAFMIFYVTPYLTERENMMTELEVRHFCLQPS
jgi:hypothetical protein